MQIFTISKLGCNVSIKVTDDISGNSITYFEDSSNVLMQLNPISLISSIEIKGNKSYSTLKISTNNVLYMNAAGTDILINSEATYLTNYALVFACATGGGGGGVPTLQQVTDVTNGNKTTNDIYNYYDIVNNYTRLTNDFNGGGSQTPALDIQKINSNGISKGTLVVQNNNPSIDDYQESSLFLYTNPVVGLSNQIALSSNISVGEITQQLSYFVNTIGTFNLEWSYPSGVPRLIYNDINLGITSSIEFSGSSIKTNFNGVDLGLKLDFTNNQYFFGGNPGVNGSTFVVDNFNGFIFIKDPTGSTNVLNFDMVGQVYEFGDIIGNNSISINSGAGNLLIKSQNNITLYRGSSGLILQGGISLLCDPDGNGNSSFFGLDDNAEKLIGSKNLLGRTIGALTNDRIKVELNGTLYYIVLETA